MPEGDTIFRTATSLRSWLGGRLITAATARDARLGVDRLVGRALVDVSTHGKHLFLEFASGPGTANPPIADADPTAVVEVLGAVPVNDALVLRTHMMMTGSWHVYRVGDRQQRPQRQVVVSLTAGDRVAVCLNAPVVELLPKRRSKVAHDLGGYGPDILADPLDTDAVVARAGGVDPVTAIGVVLLDQHVVAGIGNIYRCESLFQQRISPFTPRSAVPDGAFRELIRCASALMQANLSTASNSSRSFGASTRPFAYGRSGKPCRVCGDTVQSAKLGRQPRTVYWCPTCQPDPGDGPG